MPIFSWAVAGGLVSLTRVNFGFVNVPQVRKPALQSTSTSITWEPACVLTNEYSRNPFTDDKELQSSAASPTTISGDESSTSAPSLGEPAPGTGSLRRIPYSWIYNYIKSERSRRMLQAQVKTSLDNFFRDTGILRSFVDFMVTICTPSLAVENPDIIARFLKLTNDCIRIPYGDQPHWTQAFGVYGKRMQAIDMYLPQNDERPRGLLFFVHGGAWGSGLPWMYRLVAQPFLEEGMAVAVVGYRTWPDGDMKDQVKDLEMASEKLTQLYPDLCTEESDYGVCVMGHSSGAHIAMSMLVNRLQQEITKLEQTRDKEKMRIDSFIGLSAVYEVASHYELEIERGLEELSPLKAACGYDEECLSEYGTVQKLFRHMIKRPRHICQEVNEACPRIAMIHGDQDETTPVTYTQEAAHLLSVAGINKCDDMYLSEAGHSDTVFDLMFHGNRRTKELVMQWLQEPIIAASDAEADCN